MLFLLDFGPFPKFHTAMRFVSVLLAFLTLLAPAPAFAWGVDGHEIVAAVALDMLTPRARGQVAQLLGSPGMMIHDASWADEIRDRRPETGHWHFVDIPLAAAGYDPRRDCAGNDCAVAQIGIDRQILADRHAPRVQRAEALRFLIHFIADVHQPLHAEDDGDKGGNAVHVSLGRERTNLHRVWDNDVVRAFGYGRDADRRVAAIIGPAQRKAWTVGTPADWANEAHAIARDRIYPNLDGGRSPHLPRDYAWREQAITQVQLAKAAVRLAWVLNTVLK